MHLRQLHRVLSNEHGCFAGTFVEKCCNSAVRSSGVGFGFPKYISEVAMCGRPVVVSRYAICFKWHFKFDCPSEFNTARVEKGLVTGELLVSMLRFISLFVIRDGR